MDEHTRLGLKLETATDYSAEYTHTCIRGINTCCFGLSDSPASSRAGGRFVLYRVAVRGLGADEGFLGVSWESARSWSCVARHQVQIWGQKETRSRPHVMWGANLTRRVRWRASKLDGLNVGQFRRDGAVRCVVQVRT